MGSYIVSTVSCHLRTRCPQPWASRPHIRTYRHHATRQVRLIAARGIARCILPYAANVQGGWRLTEEQSSNSSAQSPPCNKNALPWATSASWLLSLSTSTGETKGGSRLSLPRTRSRCSLSPYVTSW